MYSKESFMLPYTTFADSDGNRYYLVFCKLKECFELNRVGQLYVRVPIMDFKLLSTGLFEFILYPQAENENVQVTCFTLNYAGQNCVIDSEFRLDYDLGFSIEIAIKALIKRVRQQEKNND